MISNIQIKDIKGYEGLYAITSYEDNIINKLEGFIYGNNETN